MWLFLRLKIFTKIFRVFYLEVIMTWTVCLFVRFLVLVFFFTLWWQNLTPLRDALGPLKVVSPLVFTEGCETCFLKCCDKLVNCVRSAGIYLDFCKKVLFPRVCLSLSILTAEVFDYMILSGKINPKYFLLSISPIKDRSPVKHSSTVALRE